MKKVKKCISIILIILIILCTVCVIYIKIRNERIEIKIDNGLEILSDENNINIFGTVNNKYGIIKVKIDNKGYKNITYNDGKFEYKVNRNTLTNGWHYIFFENGSGIFIHKLDNGIIRIIPENVIIEARKQNARNKSDYNDYMGRDKYESSNNYYGLTDSKNVKESETLRYDENGLIELLFEGEWIYHPSTLAEYGLSWYNADYKENSGLRNTKEYKQFINYCDWFVKNMPEDGALRINFDNQYLDYLLEKGWVSAMTQGLALSLLGRAYYVTEDEKYLDAGERYLQFMLKESTNEFDGCKDYLIDFVSGIEKLNEYKDYPLYEEILIKPQVYILNGDLFALMGLYDWSQLSTDVKGANLAKIKFGEALESIKIILPFYDYYGYSSYDLRQYNEDCKYNARFDSSYAHFCHISLLKAIYDVTNDEKVYEYYNTFKQYRDDVFFAQSEILYR